MYNDPTNPYQSNQLPYDPTITNPPQPPQVKLRPHKRLWSWYRHQRNISKVGIGCGILLMVVILCCVSTIAIAGPAAKHSAESQSIVMSVTTATPTSDVKQVVIQKQPTPTPKPVPTATPKAVPTPKPTNTPVPAGPPILGANISTFVSQYGQPNNHTDKASGSYHFQRYGDSNIDYLIAWTDLTDGGIYAQRIYSLDVQADNNGWSKDKVDAMCGRFLPHDAVLKSRVTLSTGYDEIYYSASLAKAFPVSEFTDANTNQVQAGMFDMLVGVNPDATINGCTIQVGTQQTQ